MCKLCERCAQAIHDIESLNDIEGIKRDMLDNTVKSENHETIPQILGGDDNSIRASFMLFFIAHVARHYNIPPFKMIANLSQQFHAMIFEDE